MSDELLIERIVALQNEVDRLRVKKKNPLSDLEDLLKWYGDEIDRLSAENAQLRAALERLGDPTSEEGEK